MRKILLLCMMFFAATTLVLAQRTVSGKVTDDSGEGLPGVNVVIKGTTTGTTTSLDGSYSLNINDDATLVFSFVGFDDQEVEVGARSVIDIAMSGATELQEIVVTAIGIESNKRALGYSVQNVGSEELANTQETNLVNALNGKAAGVTVISSSGTPGASANIRIRGNTSISGSNSPLFVVDGVPIDNSEFGAVGGGTGTGGVSQSNRAIDLNPSDIESLTVLKGPSATALYGIRAASGAIVITTKSGKKNSAPSVTISSSVEFTEVNKTLPLQRTYGQGTNGNYSGPETFSGFSWGPRISDLEYDGDENYPFDPRGRLVPTGEGNGIPARSYDSYSFFDTGVTTDNNIGVRGGTESTTYFLSAGYLNQKGVIPNSQFERISFRANISTDISEKLTASMSATYANSGGIRMQRGSNLRGVMLGMIRNSPTFDMGLGRTGQEAADYELAYQYPNGGQRSYRDGIYDNPYWVVNKNFTEDNVNRIIGYTSLNYEVIPGLNVQYKLGLDNYIDSRVEAIEKVQNNDLSIEWNPGSVVNREINSTDLNSDFIITYDKTFANDDITFNALAGHNYFRSSTTDNTTTGNTLASLDFYNISNASDVIATYNPVERELMGVYADFRIGYRDMLFLNLTGRNDWSSTLPSNDNSFFYPSVALGFVASEALNLSNTYLKVRASWGQVGNDAPVYATESYFAQSFILGDGFLTGTSFPFNSVNAFEQNGVLGNNVLRPESTSTYEFGVDLKMLGGRLGIDLTYYNSETKDQILPVTVSAASGFLSTITNAGLVSNEGIEVVLTGTPYKSGDFSWDANVNFTHYESVVEELTDGIENIFLSGFTSTSSRAIAGEPFGAIFGAKFQRNDRGQILIDPSTGYPLQDPNAGIIGDPNPDFVLGFRNTFSYKSFTLSALLDIRKGGDIWNGTNGIANYFGTSKKSADTRNLTGVVFNGVLRDSSLDNEDGLQVGGVANNVQTDFANEAQGIGSYRYVRYGFGGLGESNIQDGSWVRLREVSLTYNLPGSILDNTPFKTAAFSVVGRNLWLETAYAGIDPETNLTGATNGFGLDYFNNPNTKGYTFKLRLGL